tara:strand:- start:474 stop:1169 length:696 start_codon:yes stop_codon:yes gene_type:complete
MDDAALIAWLSELAPGSRKPLLEKLEPQERRELRYFWELWARPEQLPPPGEWSVWLICAGRGFGKTRAGAEWVRQVARANPDARIALIGASLGEARSIMVEGESGLLAVSPPYRRPVFEPSLRRIVWPNGAQAYLYSAAEPESLRGPQHSHACRAGAEGDFRQRSTGQGRRALAAHRRRHCRRTSGKPGIRRVLDRISLTNRSVRGPRERTRVLAAGAVDVHHPSTGHVGL